MDYELALKLADAGFPDRKVGETFRNRKNYGIFPSLRELIEACINSGGYTGFGLGWNKVNEVWTSKLESKADNHICVGSTPEKAVANLWLALKKD